ncbi:MAG: DUF4214 domain-containing protein [Betaproteobacteria bacterium]|nr:DUF4214 domain-containing protein [Betaproteobacteria bacterium]
MATSEFIQQAYIAFFNRPADADGFNFWLNHTGSDQDLLDLFAQSEEYQRDYGGLTNRQIISKVYHNLFGRPPETEGWDYWETQMNAGWVTIGNAAYAILGGAQDTDLTTINNKTTAAQAFTNALDTTIKINAYTKASNYGLSYLAKEWLAAVSYSDESLETAASNLNNVLTTLVNDDMLPKDNATITLSTDANAEEVLIWSWFTPNRTKFTLVNFDTSSATGQDRLVFKSFGASWLGAATLNENGYAIFEIPSHPVAAVEDRWHATSDFPLFDLNNGDKYLTFTRLNDSTTEYKIELWTVVGGIADAYYDIGAYRASVDDDTSYDIGDDTAQLIGYVDIGREIDWSVVNHIDF